MIALLLCPLIGRAQELTATLSGVVTDSSGAVIPHALVTITLNGDNGIARQVESDGSGNYVATNLTAGTYSVTVAAPGFETYKGKDIVLDVAEKHAVNVQLKAGSAATTVTVEDNPVSVDTESSAQAGTISGTQVRELELANRNFEQLVVLQPGVVNALGDNVVGGGSTGISVNGARTTANNWTVDGADINDSGSNATITNVPSVDAIQEITLQRGSYDAGYGRSGGGQVLVATRSGTSAFHGGAYEFDRNTALNANDYFNKQQQIAAGEPNTPAVYHYNNFGFTIGGPVFIPKAYNTSRNKTFFFVSEEWFKNTQPGNASFAAATSAEIGGVVPGQFTNGPANCLSYDASTNSTTIAPSCFSKNSQVYLTNVYAKNPANSGGNYEFSYSAKQNEHEDIVRVDHYFNDKVHFFARGMNDDFPNNQPMGLWAGNNYPSLVNTAVDSPGKNVVGNLTWAISPRIVNEVEFVWAQGTYNSTIQSGQFATSPAAFSAMTNNWAYTDPYGRVPAITIASGLQGYSPGSAPWKERNLDRTYYDNLAITLGKHTLRTGFQFQQMIKTENAVDGGPNFKFNTWGDFLLGNVLVYQQQSRDITPDLHYINSEAYVQDDWKINRRLTLNLGVRWSRFPSATDVKNTLNNFDPRLYNSANAPVIDPTTGNFDPTQTALIPATYTNGIIFPQGAACTAAQAVSSQVTCSPYGSYINPNNNANFGPRLGFAYNPDGRGITAIRGGFGIFYDRLLNGIWEQNAFSNPPLLQTTTVNNTSFDDPSGANAISYGPNGLTVTGTPIFKVPNYANYNLSVQRQLLPTTTLEIAYVGNVARHLLGEFDMNQPTEAARDANPTSDVNALRPYLGYGFMHSRAPLFTNNYNSLQVTVQHRSSKGLTLGAAYTWSKDLTTNSNDRGTSASNSYDFKHDYGPSTTNTPQVLEVNYIYQLPFYKQQLGFVGHVLGGWEVSGISSFVSGASFTVTQTTDPFAAIGPNGLGMIQDADIQIRPDQVAPIHRVKTEQQWFSTSSFNTAAGHFGSERVGSLLGPGLQDWDLASIKNVNLGEHVKFQLRGEYFNAFNHTNFNAVDSVVSDSNFGQVTSAHVPRRIQIGAKLNF
ncbi:TonB-dependent receptor [Acidicapsa acidisoli]|uniref:TonB-dependent receptor n=1 Tax=Acidicapsa acidisoli TaxID=1615681 RepID=UPI0021DFF836|nr:TonB-dependent receptor [Acidicapsa acidisoli]